VLAAGYDLDFGEPAYSDDATSTRGRVRFPTGQDHAAVLPWIASNPARANSALFTRVVSQVGRRARLTEDDARAMSMRVRRQITDFLDASAPGPDLRIDIVCPHCGNDMSYEFDLVDFFFFGGARDPGRRP
jgi:hypothetical protein